MPAMIPHLQTIPPARRWRYVRGWALRHLDAHEAPGDTGREHGPALDCGCGWGRLCDFHASDCEAAHPTHNGRCWAVWQGVGVSTHGRDAIEYAQMDTGAVHGPALPTASQLASHYGIGFGRYCGPWITRSGFRLGDAGPRVARTIPNPADLRRTRTCEPYVRPGQLEEA